MRTDIVIFSNPAKMDFALYQILGYALISKTVWLPRSVSNIHQALLLLCITRVNRDNLPCGCKRKNFL